MEHIFNVTNDFVFKKIFGTKGNEDILKGLVESIINREISSLKIIEDTKLEKTNDTDKLGILDIKAILSDGTKVNIEMQVVNHHDILERTLFYWSKLYTSGFKQGNQYIDLPKTITINILKYNFLPDNEYCLSSHLHYDKYPNEYLTDKLEIYFIDLIKFKKIVRRIDSRLAAWLSFITRGNKEMVDEALTYEKAIKKAEKILKSLEDNKEAMRIYELREKKLHDDASYRGSGYRDGLEDGVKKSKDEMARRLIAERLDLETISRITELPISELEKLM